MVLNIILILVNILVLALIYIILRRRIDKLTDTDLLTSTLTGELDIILSEINQATERNVLIIEDKINQLEEIIQTAEKRITLLRKSIQPEVKTPLVKKAAPEKPVKPEENIQLEFEKGELTYSHLNRMNVMSNMVTPLSVQEKTDEKSDSIKKKIIELHRSGIDTSMISANVGINRGEVELIISLYEQTNGQEYNG